MSGQKGKSEYLIYERRRLEDLRAGYEQVAKETFKVSTVAHWENKTHKTIQQNQVKQKYDRLQAQADEELHLRRLRLADLLRNEEAELARELRASEQTVEERFQEMRERANKLRERRENDRVQFVDEMRKKQWRLACDDLRTLDSQAQLLHVHEERYDQLREKEAKLHLAALEEAEGAELWEADRQRKIKREIEDVQAQKERDREVVETLNSQLVELAQRRAEMQRLKDEETRLLKEKWEMERLEDEERERISTLDKAKRLAELSKFNQEKAKQREIIERAERELDLKLLRMVLQKEAEEDAYEEARKQQVMEEARQYRKHLMEQMKKEAQDTSELERLLQAEMDKAWQKRIDQWDREDAARKKLQQEVHEERMAQLQEKHRLQEIAQQEAEIEAARIKVEQEKMAAMDREEEERQARKRMENREFLEKQIEERRLQRKLLENEKKIEMFAFKKAEEEYRARLAAELKDGGFENMPHIKMPKPQL